MIKASAGGGGKGCALFNAATGLKKRLMPRAVSFERIR